MKSMILTAAMAIAATSASADNLTFFAQGEYAYEAEVFSTEVGADINAWGVVITPTFNLDNADGDYSFVNAELQVGYMITDTATVYVRVETDEDFHYSEAVLGARFEF